MRKKSVSVCEKIYARFLGGPMGLPRNPIVDACLLVADGCRSAREFSAKLHRVKNIPKGNVRKKKVNMFTENDKVKM